MSERAREVALDRVQQELRAVLQSARRSVGERSRAVHPGLQGASYLLLEWLARSEPLRASEIVEALGCDKGALSRQLQHLAELGLVERTPDPHDRRATLVAVTAAARTRLAEVDTSATRDLDTRLAGWTAEDLDELASRLAGYNRALADPHGKSRCERAGDDLPLTHTGKEVVRRMSSHRTREVAAR